MTNQASIGWEARKLHELGFVGRGKSKHRPRNDKVLFGGDYPFFQTGDVKSAGYKLRKYSQTYNEIGLAQSKLWQPGTLCITIAANIADTAILDIPGCFPDSIVGFVPDKHKADVRFVKYSIDTLKLQMRNISRGTTQDNLSVDKLLLFDILTPSFAVQQKIAGVLGAYDDLIENNSKRIGKLEAMACLLYRHYFEVSEAADWDIVKIGDILGKAPTSAKLQKSEYLDEGIYPVIDQGKEYIAGYTNKQEAVIADKLPLTVFGDHTRAVKLAHDPFARGADGTQIVVSDILPPYYLYQTIKDLPLSNEHYARHFKLLKATEIARPPENILSEFEAKAELVFKLINTLTKRNRNLAKARDLLLPRLMSGEITV